MYQESISYTVVWLIQIEVGDPDTTHSIIKWVPVTNYNYCAYLFCFVKLSLFCSAVSFSEWNVFSILSSCFVYCNCRSVFTLAQCVLGNVVLFSFVNLFCEMYFALPGILNHLNPIHLVVDRRSPGGLCPPPFPFYIKSLCWK